MIAAPGARPKREGTGPGTEGVSGTLLGFDFGERRIGIAVAETATGLAHPLETIDTPVNGVRFARIASLVAEWRPAALVVGRPPPHADGSPHPVALLAEKFGRRLAARHGLPVFYVDETLTSATAEADLRAAGARSRAGDVDALAATLILQSYLDAPGAQTP